MGMREKLIDIVETYADFLDWETKYYIVDSIMELLATDNNVGDKLTPTDDKVSAVGVWIPVTERLPKREDANLYESVLAINKEDGVSRSWIWDVVADYHEKFTHWMPLPEAPKGE